MNERQIKNRQVIGLFVILLTFTGLLIYFIINKDYEIKERLTGIASCLAMILIFATGFTKLK